VCRLLPQRNSCEVSFDGGPRRNRSLLLHNVSTIAWPMLLLATQGCGRSEMSSRFTKQCASQVIGSATASAVPHSGIRPPRLRRRYVVTSDGSRVFDSLWDAEFSVPCVFRAGSDGMMRCYPALQGVSASSPTFVDPACKVPILYICTSPPVEPKLVRFYPPERGLLNPPRAPNEYAYARVGSPINNVDRVFHQGTTCEAEPSDSTSGCGYYRLGSPVPNADFVTRQVVSND